jgi:very-short-patch-repair endonuclease
MIGGVRVAQERIDRAHVARRWRHHEVPVDSTASSTDKPYRPCFCRRRRTLTSVNPEIEKCLADGGGVATRRELLAVVTRHVLAQHVGVRDRAELRRLLDRLGAGCRSELELWGFERVFRGRAFAGAVWQHRVQAGGRAVYLDVAFPLVRVAVELDGAAWHGSYEQRERDIRRDAALAALGWVVLRVSHRRLHAEPDAVRREVLTVLQRRQAQVLVA